MHSLLPSHPSLRLLRRTLGLINLLFLALAPAWAATYYVRPGGNDRANGTSIANAWATVAKVSGASLAPGDIVCFEGGSTFTGTLTVKNSGTSAAPIVYGSYGTGRATISSGTARGLVAASKSHVIVRDLVFTGNGYTANSSIGLDFTVSSNASVSNIRLERLSVSGYGSFGVSFRPRIQGTTKYGFRDVTISEIHSFNNKDSGLSFAVAWIVGSTTYAHANITVRDSWFYRNRGYGTPNSSGNGLILGDVNGALVDGCIAYENGLECTTTGGGPVGIWSWDSNAVIIQRCESYRNGNAGPYDGGGFDIDGGNTNCIIQYCYSHDNSGAGYLVAQFSGANRPARNNVIRYNLSVNDARDGDRRNQGAIHVWNAAGNAATQIQDTFIYGNTVYLSLGSDAFRTADAATTNTRVFNNLFITENLRPTLRVQQPGGILLQNNLYWTGYLDNLQAYWGGAPLADLPALRALGQEMLGTLPVGRISDPRLLSPGLAPTFNSPTALAAWTAYTLQSDSPAIDVGLSPATLLGATTSTGSGPAIAHPGARDFAGVSPTLGAASDLGAYEHPALAPSAPIIEPDQSVLGTVGQTLLYPLLARRLPTSYTLASGTLPPGVAFNSATGVLSGIPTVAGTYYPSFTATNSSGTSAATPVLMEIAPSPAPLLTGTVTGTPAWAGNPSWDAAKALDRDPATYFAPDGTNTWVRLDLGLGRAAQPTTLRFLARSGYTGRMVGGRFESSADGLTWTTLHTVANDPGSAWQTITLTGAPTHRYFRYFHPGLADVAEIEFRGQISALADFRTTFGLPEDGSADLATPAGDDVPNLLKYAFNLIGSGPGQAPALDTPHSATLDPEGSAGLPFADLAPAPDSTLRLTYVRRKPDSAPGITYAVEFATDLFASLAWQTNPHANETVAHLDPVWERVSVIDGGPEATLTRRFARVRVTSLH
jgi:hypothetical protein